MAKVYCKDCRYFIDAMIGEYCYNSPVKDSPTQRRLKMDAYVTMNAKNDCKKFKAYHGSKFGKQDKEAEAEFDDWMKNEGRDVLPRVLRV